MNNNMQIRLDPISQLPEDINRIIFKNSVENLPAMALVSKAWQTLADDTVFKLMIRPAETIGTEEWKEYIGYPGKEPPLPRCAYGDLIREGGTLTFIPLKVKVTKDDGTFKEIVLESLEVIEALFEKYKKDLRTNYTVDSWYYNDGTIKDKRPLDVPHWVWLKKKAWGIGKSLRERQNLTKVPGENISSLIDTVCSIFMGNVRAKKPQYMQFHDKHKPLKICVSETGRSGKYRICLVINCDPKGLRIDLDQYDSTFDAGFVTARKFYEIPRVNDSTKADMEIDDSYEISKIEDSTKADMEIDNS